MKRLWKQCAGNQKKIALLAGGVLPEQEQAALETHLDVCPTCRCYYQKVQTLGKALAKAAQAMPDIDPTPAMRQRWMRALHGAQGSPHHPAEVADLSLPSGWYWPWKGPRIAWGSLACVWGLIFFFHVTAPELPPFPASPVSAAPKTVWHLLRIQRDWLVQYPYASDAPRHRPADSRTPNAPRSRRDTATVKA